jgi:hypothetical protein
VTIQGGDATRPAVASPVTGEDRERLYAEQARRDPHFGGYEPKTTRRISTARPHRGAG